MIERAHRGRSWGPFEHLRSQDLTRLSVKNFALPERRTVAKELILVLASNDNQSAFATILVLCLSSRSPVIPPVALDSIQSRLQTLIDQCSSESVVYAVVKLDYPERLLGYTTR